MSYEKSLRSSLKEKDEGLFNRLKPIEDAARSVLTYTAAGFPSFTPHDFSHSLNVEENLNWIITDSVKQKMQASEIFLILISAWLHDWGMVSSVGENAERVRETHHIRTQKNFENLFDKINLSPAEGRIAGRICRGHRKEDLNASDYSDSFLGSNIPIRVGFLAAALRIADELDTTASRTPQIVYATIKPQGLSEEEFQKHLSITGVGQPTLYKIVISGEARSPKGVELIEKVRKKIEKELNSVKKILNSNGILLDVVEANILTKGFINKPICFNLDKRNIVDLLVGKALYNRKDVAIRELLQNAVDTCRFRKIIDPEFNATIIIEFDDKSISFEDNGIGMNYEDALDFFSKKGISFYTSKDYFDALDGKSFDPISKFGIGVLSTFIMADSLIVESKKENCSSCKFTISNIADGWLYEEGVRNKSGTKITMGLKELGKQMNLIKSIKHYCKNIEIPVFIKDKKNNQISKLISSWNYDMDEVLESFDVERKSSPYKSQPVFILKSMCRDLEMSLIVFDSDYFEKENCFLAKQGIYVGNFQLFPIAEKNWITLIDVKSDVIDLTVSRDKIQENKKYEFFLIKVFNTFIDMINDNFKKDEGIKKVSQISKFLDLLFEEHFGVEKDDTQSCLLVELWKRRMYPVIFNDNVNLLTGEEIASKKFKTVMHYCIAPENVKENIELLTQFINKQVNEELAIVVDLGPHLSYIKRGPSKFYCSFCDNLKLFNTTVECCTISNVLAAMEFTKQETHIDSLLPEKSFFSHLPANLRSLVIEISPFIFNPSPEVSARSTFSFKIARQRLIGRELFCNEPEISDIYNSHLGEKEKSCAMTKKGNFVYDIDDPLLNFLVDKSEQILASTPLRSIVQRYLKKLAIYYSGPTFMKYSEELESLIFLEKTLAEILGYQNYKPINERYGKLAECYIIY